MFLPKNSHKAFSINAKRNSGVTPKCSALRCSLRYLQAWHTSLVSRKKTQRTSSLAPRYVYLLSYKFISLHVQYLIGRVLHTQTFCKYSQSGLFKSTSSPPPSRNQPGLFRAHSHYPHKIA